MRLQYSLVELGKRLLASSRDGDTAEEKALINKGAPFTTDWLGTSPLHLGCSISMLLWLLLFMQPFQFDYEQFLRDYTEALN